MEELIAILQQIQQLSAQAQEMIATVAGGQAPPEAQAPPPPDFQAQVAERVERGM